MTMKKMIKKRIAFALIISMMLSNSLTIMATEPVSVSDNTERTSVREQDSNGSEEPVTDVSQNEPDETGVSENETSEPEQKETVSEDNPVPPESVSDDSGEAVSGNGEEAAAGTTTKFDCFGNMYTYDHDNWYKDYIYSFDGQIIYISNLTDETKTQIGENVFIPAVTNINGKEYTTHAYFGLFQDTSVRHVCFENGVITENFGHFDYDGSYSFHGCKNLESVDASGVDMSEVSSLWCCFEDCESLRSLSNVKFGNNTSNIKHLTAMFCGCVSLVEADFSEMSFPNVTDMSFAFYNCKSLVKVDLSGIGFSDEEGSLGFADMFYGCSSLQEFEFPSIDISRNINISSMFSKCYLLKKLDLSKMKTSGDVWGTDGFLDEDYALQVLYMPYYSHSADYMDFPVTMYHEGEKYEKSVIIDSDKVDKMSGWVFTVDNVTVKKPRKNADGTTWDCIWFGHYFQDGYEDELYLDKEPIKWRILDFDINTGEALLLANYNLAKWRYASQNSAVSWNDSDIRKWLNSNGNCWYSYFGYYHNLGFKRNAFTFSEQAAITESDIDGVKDKVFLLSFEDVSNEDYGFNDYSPDKEGGDGFFTADDPMKMAYNTNYCKDEKTEDDVSGNWFLRDRHYIVEDSGRVYKWKDPDYTKRYKIRPAIRLNLYEHPYLWRDAGTVTMTYDGGSSWHETEARPFPVKPADTWQFNNSKASDNRYYPGFMERNCYEVSKDDYEKFIYGIKNKNDYPSMPKQAELNRFAEFFIERSTEVDLREFQKIKDRLKMYNAKRKKWDWNGSCYGMSLTYGLYSCGEYVPKGYNHISDVKIDPSYMPHPFERTESEINRYHFMQIMDCRMNNRVKGVGKIKKKAIEEEDKPYEKKGFLVSFRKKDSGMGHTLFCKYGGSCLITDKDNEGNDVTYTYFLRIYDPNNSIYDDDYCYIYINSDETMAYLPCENAYFYEDQMDGDEYLEYVDASLSELAKPSKVTDPDQFIGSKMKIVSIFEKATGKFVEFIEGKKKKGSTLGASLDVPSNYSGENDTDFGGGFYMFDSIIPSSAYSIAGGEDDLLDAAFEYGDHTVDVYADKTGVSAEFSNNGDVELRGLDATDFVINNVFNEDCSAKPGKATRVVVSANGTGDVSYKKNAQGEFELDDGDNSKTLRNISFVIGTMLKSEKAEPEGGFPDAKGKITVSFDAGKVIVKEDTNGDRVPDYETSFFDYVPVTKITVTPTTASLAAGETKTLSANIEPENATDKHLFWYSENPAVATVSDGVVRGVSKGTAVIRAVGGIGGKSGTCTVTVTGGGSDDPDDPDIPDDAPEEGIWIKGLKKAYTYTGSAIKPEFRVYRGKKRLYEKTDYTLKYKNNKKPGTATVTLKMKGNYSGSKDVTFKIDPASLSANVSADTVYAAYKPNRIQKPKPVLYVNGTKVKYGKNDLSFTYPSTASQNGTAYRDIGTWKIHIASKNTRLFTGEKDVDLVIVDRLLMSGVTIKPDKENVPYDGGRPVSPKFTLKYGSQKMTEGRDYTVIYEDDHSDIGKHKVTFVGNNKDFFGKKTYTFSITGKYDLTDKRAEVSINDAYLNTDGSVPFTNGGAKPEINVRFDGSRLRAGKDYTVTYTNHKVLGTATATVKGKGKYKGSVPVRFTVGQRDINTISPNIPDKVYSNRNNAYKNIAIVFNDRDYKNQRLKKDTDYTISYEKDYGLVPAQGTEIMLTLEGKGNYTGKLKTSYRIIDKNYDLSKAKVVVNGSKAYAYTGKEIRPEITDLNVTLNGNTLGRDSYEILGYYNNVKKGNSAYIVLGGKGSYGGKKTVKFKIGATPVEKEWTGVILKLKTLFAM